MSTNLTNITQFDHSAGAKALDGRTIAAARQFVGWSQSKLASEAGVARRTIADYETELRRPAARTFLAIHDALNAAGVRFWSDYDANVYISRCP